MWSRGIGQRSQRCELAGVTELKSMVLRERAMRVEFEGVSQALRHTLQHRLNDDAVELGRGYRTRWVVYWCVEGGCGRRR